MRPPLALSLGLLLCGIALSGGCATCNHTAFAESMQPIERVTVTAPARDKVYAFFMNGADLLELNGFTELRDGLVCAGFPKIYYAQRADREWYRKELHRLHRDDPDARFILVGYGSAAEPMQELACQVSREEIPLDAVVYIDPICAKGDLTQNVPYRAVILKSHHWLGAPRLKAPETVTIDRVGHIGVPRHPATLQYFVDLMTESAMKVPLPDPTIVCRPVLNEKRAIPRPAEPQEIKPPPPGWDFLCPNGR
jgi:hypothetical protein